LSATDKLEQLPMNPTLYRGVDVSKKYLDVDGFPKRFANQEAGIESLFSALGQDEQLVCESSGGYEQALLNAAWRLNRPISVVMPARVRAFARSRGQHAKTDLLDRALLTQFGQERRPGATPAPSALRKQVRALLRAREHVLAAELMEKNYREHLPSLPLLQQSSDERLAVYAKQRKQIEQQIDAVLATEPKAKAQIARLRQLKSVGKITAWTAWADLPELGDLEPGQPAALCGLAPYPDDSGERQGPRHIQHGRATLRRVLYMAAISASQHNPVLKAVYQRLRSRGKPAKVALTAIARRIVEMLNLLLKNPNFELAS
jgi:transposase